MEEEGLILDETDFADLPRTKRPFIPVMVDKLLVTQERGATLKEDEK